MLVGCLLQMLRDTYFNIYTSFSLAFLHNNSEFLPTLQQKQQANFFFLFASKLQYEVTYLKVETKFGF